VTLRQPNSVSVHAAPRVRLASRCAMVLGVLLTGFAANAAAAGPPTDRGAALFTEKCAMCHRVMGMGTVLLTRRRDAATAQLEKRSDLTVEFVTAAARAGLGNMPRISRGEVSDADLAAIAAWLAVPAVPTAPAGT